MLKKVTAIDVPQQAEANTVYHFIPADTDEAYYSERTDRQIGWITREEQNDIVRRKVIGIAGCGGMGGALAEVFVKLGIDELRIADNEVFDVSNINRQRAAGRYTVGKSKALETARFLRWITDDSLVITYPQGICKETVDGFVDGCSIICDEIEFWCVASRILLHEKDRKAGCDVFVCNTIGYGSHLFLFTPQSATMEDCLSMSYDEAKYLQAKIATKYATKEELKRVIESMKQGLFFEWPEYSITGASLNNRNAVLKHLMEEGKGAILPTNPSLAAGFLSDRILLHMLRDSSIKRQAVPVPTMPGYLYIDGAKGVFKSVTKRWW
jgi:molybdopterin/thiamine biosynthesis adenylyltransferase